MKTIINNARRLLPCWLRAITMCLLIFLSIEVNAQTCTAPSPGNTLSSVSTACYNAPFTLSLQNPTPGSGVTYFWESSDDPNFMTNVVSLGTLATQLVSETVPMYYRCQVTCANGPLTAFSTPVYVDVTSPIDLYAAGINLSCHGSNTGEVYLSVSGGTNPYTYNWNSGLSSSDFITNLAAGTYSVVVTDGNGCTATTSATLSEPPALNEVNVISNTSASGVCDGSITINATGGTPPYMYSIDGGATYLASNVFPGLCATLYAVRVQDAAGCLAGSNATVNFPSAALVNTSLFMNVSTNDFSTAHVVWGMPASVSPMQIEIQRSDDGVNFTTIAAANSTTLVNVMSLPVGSTMPMGAIFLSTEMQQRLLFNEVLPNVGPDTKIFYRAKMTNPASGLEMYTVTAQFLPPGIAIQPFPIGGPPCPPIDLIPPGYSVVPGWVSTQQIGCCLVTKKLFMNLGCLNPMPCKDCLPACTCMSDPCCVHNCAQYAMCGCVPWASCGTPTTFLWLVTSSVSIAPVINTVQTNVSCNGGSNGTITILGATSFCKRNKIIGAPACFAASHPLPWPNALGQISNTFTGLCAGCYTIMVKDCNGCTSTKVVCITQPTPIVLSAVAVNSCSCSGKITVTATGGTPCAAGYTYQMLPTGAVQTSNVFNNLCVGCYTIKVTDCNGCTKTIVKCITGTTFNLAPVKVEPCFGTNNGSICITNTTATINPCLKYSIGTTCTATATTLFSLNPCFTGLVAGSYCIIVRDTCANCDTCICVTLSNSNIPCGKTNSIVVNTGYDPVTGTKIIPNAVVDPLWTVTAIGGSVFGPVSTTSNAAWITNPNSHAIGFGNGDQAGQRTYRRSFKMCSCDSITFNLNLAYDNWLNGIYIDGILVTIPSTITPVALQGSTTNFTTFHNFTFKKYLCAGTHTIDVRVFNLGGPSGLNLWGSVSGTSNSIVTNVSPVNCCCSCTVFQTTANTTNVSCNGGSNGTICMVTPTSVPTACWKYRIGSSCTNMGTASQSNPCFTGLAAGNYCVRITDTCTGCDTCICVTITQPTPITLTATSVNTCSCNGSITVTATGGTPCTAAGGYTYQILPAGLPQASPTFNGLCPGCYTIKVTDCNGCTATIVKCITAVGSPAGLVPNVINPLCNGGTGSICIVSSTGTVNPCLKYALVTPNCQLVASSVLTSNPCFTGLVAGNYCIKVKDTCTGCDTCICVTITQPTPITLTATSVNTCSCNGSITVTATGGTPCAVGTGYTYQILPAGLPQASPTFNGLCPGCYTIKVTDCNGCTATIVKCITAVGSPTGLVPTVTNVSCNGGNNGTICINSTIVPPNPCLKYAMVNANCQLLTSSVFTSNPCFTGLTAGNYCIKVKDTCTGCDTCICVTITQPTPITLTATSVNTCSCNGSITVTATGGTPCTAAGGYTYQILPAGLPQASPTFNGLCPGCYTIKVTDCNGCTATIVKCITAVGSPTGLVPNVINPLCNGGTGSICIVSSTGTVNPCLKYAMVNANCQLLTSSVFTSNPCFTGLVAGNYCIKVKDTCTGCDTCICVTITQPTPITLTATSVNTCSCNGSITVTATGGTPCTAAGGYTYQILPAGLPQASPTFNGLCPGCYTIKVTDCNGCTATIVKCITAVGSPTGLVPNVINPLCNGGTGTICINNATGTVNPCLKYAMVTPNCQLLTSSVFTSNPCFTGLTAGNYCIKVKDTCTGCDTCICVTITQPSPITLTATSVNTCSCNGSITVTATGGTPCTASGGYTYQILPAGLPQASPTFNGLCPGCYTIKVTDCNGCTATIVKCITAVGSPTGLVPNVINPLCNGGTGSICIVNSTGTVNPCLKYALVTPNCQLIASSVLTSNPCFTGLVAGNYCIKVKDTCTGCDTCICVTITQPTPITLTATSVNTCSCNGSITVTATGGTPCATTPTGYTYQILPAGLPQASPTFNGLCPGCYTIKVTDCNGCTATIVKCVLAVGSPTSLVPVVTNPLCNGGTGTICINNATGTVNPCLKYAMVTPNCQLIASSVLTSNPCFTGLTAGNYCIKVKDTCTGCDTCICVTITQPSPITLTATSVNTCSCNGSITVTATGGTPCATTPTGYTYQILPAGLPQASPTFNGLCPGCYTIKVTDCNGCTATIVKCVLAVGSPTGLVPNVINPLCNGGTGSICIVSSTGTVNPCLKYALVTPNCQLIASSVLTSNPCFTGLVAGNYCIKVKDTCTGCDTCICVTITQPSPITLTATSVNTCSCNGSITVTATGGTPCTAAGGYTYQILPAGLPQASPTFNGLCPGCYTIKVTDCNGCTATIVKCVLAVGSPTGLVPAVTNVSCNGGNNGTICINSTIVPPNPCLKYAMVNANCQLLTSSVFTSNPCFTGLTAGNYCIKVKDTCTGCDTCICVTITQPTPITLTATSVNTCACNGSITVTATGGTPCTAAGGYTYQILPAGLPQASPTFNSLCPGCYTIKVTDCNGCTATIVKCITAVGSPTGLVPNVINPLCNGGTGSICIVSSTGTVNPCLKYALVTPNCQLIASSVLTSNPCFTGLTAGNYCIKVKDTCTGCDTCICVTITQPTPITLTATSVNTCSCNGSITVTATGGTPCTASGGYTYQILPAGLPQASPTFNGLCPGCYTIKVTDCNGCTATIVKCITAVGSPTGLVPTVTNVSCNGGNNGTICINSTIVPPNPCLKYAMVNANCQLLTSSVFTSNPCFTGLVAGNYCIKVKDTCTGCDTCICVTITQPTPITLTATSVNTCSCNGSITVTATGGTPCTASGGYTYQILPAGLPQASPTFNGLCPGCYTIKVTDCNGCTATIVKCVLAVGSPTGLVPNVINPLCNGGTGSICIVSSTGTVNPCLKYAMVTPNCQLLTSSVFTSNPCFTGLVAGNYCIKVKDTCTGCDTCICVTITQPTPITLTATSVNTCSCNGSITVTATGGTPCTAAGGYTYQILPAGLPQASPTFNGLCPGCYTIKVTDCNGCTATIVKCITAVGSPTGLVPNVINPLCNGGTGSICIVSSTGTVNPCLKYAMVTPNCQLLTSSVFTSNPCFTGLVAGNYCVKVKDTCTGCDTCICVTITQPTPITLTATSVNTCSCNGSITVTATGGTPCTAAGGYTYQILPAGLPQASPTFNGLCPGCYTIKVTDCNGCTATIVKCITAVGSPTGLVPNVINPLCNGGTGSICIVSSTGTVNPCLKYAMVTPNCQLIASSVFTSNPCFTGLVAGNYCIKVKDTCTGCDTCICVTITQPTPITLTATSVNTCSCNGSITVTATGGTPCAVGTGYTYQILPAGLPQASPTFNGLCPGCYTIKVTDCNGCTATIVKCVLAVGSPTGLVPNVINPLCNGGTGSICIVSSTGTVNPCLKYAMVNANCQLLTSSVFTSNPCFTGLTAGNYCIKVKDTCTGCDTCICVTITQPSPITLTATSVNTCSCNGSITVTATGGTPCGAAGGYSYQLLPIGLISPTGTFTGLCPGCYTVIVTDCNGCTSSIVQCITGSGFVLPAPIVMQPTSTTPFGQILFPVPIDPCVLYRIGSSCTDPTNPFTPNPVFNGLPPGNYCIYVKNVCTGCDTCICVTINQLSPFIVTATGTNSCPGLNNGTATANVSGGVPPYTYAWSNGQMLPTIIGLAPGSYTVVVTDANGTTGSSVVVIGVSPCSPLTLNLTAFIQGYYTSGNMMAPVLFNQGVSTNTNLTDQITVELRSPVPPYNVVASTVAMLQRNGHATCTFSNANQGLYYIVVKHRNGLQTWSANPSVVSASASTSTYNFTTSSAKAYGDNMVEVEPGVWAFYSGDINQDENVDLTDFSLYEDDANNFLYGYLPTDVDGDGSVDLLDSPVLENNINQFIFSNHP